MPGKGKKVKHGELDRKITRAVVDDGHHKFGRLIEIKGNVASLAVPDQLAGALATAMTDAPPDDPGRDSAIPAGYTFFGQFIDHDVTAAGCGSITTMASTTCHETRRGWR